MIKYKRITKGSMKRDGIEARPIQGKTVSTRDIAMEIEKAVGIPAIRTLSVLDAFVEMAYAHLGDGEPVVLDGFGTFKTGLAAEGGAVSAKKINLICSVRMKERLKAYQTLEETGG